MTGFLPSFIHFFSTAGAADAEALGATAADAEGAASAVAETVGAAVAAASAVAEASVFGSSAFVHAASKQTVTNANFFMLFSTCNLFVSKM